MNAGWLNHIDGIPSVPTFFRILCAWLISATALFAAVELKNVSLQYGTSPRMLQRSWAFFNYRVVNTEDEAVTVEVLLRPKDQRNTTVYSKQLTVGPKADLRARMLVTIGTVESYDVELYRDGNLLTKEEVLMKLGSPNDQTIYFVNDELDLEYGNFAKNKSLDGRFKTTFVRADRLPEFWNGYDHVHMIVLMRPDYATMSQRQMDAIVDYVSRGGTVLFDDPHGLVEARQTRLGELLNVQPLRIRRIERLTALHAIGGTDVTWEDGEDILETAPLGDGITTLWQDELPVLRWSRYGLGTVGCMMINPSQRGFRDPEDNFNAVWTHILGYGGQSHWPSSQADGHVVNALDTLTGIEIPKRATVRNLLVGILVVALLIIGAGHVAKRQLTAWLVLASLSLCTTVVLFIYGQSMVKDLPAQTATVMHFRTWGVERVTGDQLTSLVSKSDSRVDLVGPDGDLYLRSLTPSHDRKSPTLAYQTEQDGPEDHVDRGKDEVLADPIRIQEMNNIRQVDGMHLPTRTPKSFAALYSRVDRSAVGAGPVVEWSAAGPTMEPWTIPAGVKADHAILIYENGFTRLHLADGKVSIGATKRPQPDVESLEQFLYGIATPSPTLVLFAAASEDGAGVLSEDFTIRGRVITFVPITQSLTEQPLKLPLQRQVMTPKREAGKGTQMLMPMEGGLGPPAAMVGMPGPGGSPVDVPRHFLFEASLPAGFGQLQATGAEVLFRPDNRGGNIRFSVQLRPWDATDESLDVQATRTEDDVYYFDDLPPGFVDPTSGKLLVVVTEEQKTVYTNRAAAMRPNAWVVQEIKTAVYGTLPAATTGRY